MKVFLPILFIVIFLNCCQTKKTPNTKILMNADRIDSAFIDSLNKYANTDSTLLIDQSKNEILFAGKANNVHFAFIVADSILTFYENTNNQWKKRDLIKYKLDFSFVNIIDLNGDFNKDIRISSISGAAGNTENIVFLYEPKLKIFNHNVYYDLPNVSFDQKSKIVKSSWFAGVVHCQEKSSYKVTGDSLTFDMGVTYCPDEKTEGRIGILEFYKMVGNKKVVIKRKTGNSDELGFDRAIWNSENE